MNRLVSVVTPTWRRRDLLLGAIENVRDQVYRPLEHVIVSDGPDEAVAAMVDEERDTMARLLAHGEQLTNGSDPVPIVFAELGQHWTGILEHSYAAAPMLVASFLARGAYQVWLADDERMAPDHVESLVAALRSAGADFAYSRTRMYRAGQAPADGYEIGANPPQRGQITNVLYRANLLAHGLYQLGDDRTSDWATIARWMDEGATWAYVDRVTLTHRADR